MDCQHHFGAEPGQVGRGGTSKPCDQDVLLTKVVQDDPQNVTAHRYLHSYYFRKGDLEKSKEEWKMAFKYSNLPLKHWRRNLYLYWMYNAKQQHLKSLDNYFQYKSSRPVTEILMPSIIWSFWRQLSLMGFEEVAGKYSREILSIDSDSLHFVNRLVMSELMNGNFERGLEYGEKLNQNEGIWCIHKCYFYLGEYSMAYQNIEMFMSNNYRLKMDDVEIAYLYEKKGDKFKADSCYKVIEEKNLKEIEFNRPNAQWYESHFNLVCIYSAQNKTKDAMNYLRYLKKREVNDTWLITRMEYNSMLDNIRSEPEFIEILELLKRKFRFEHKKVKELLEEEGELEESNLQVIS